ncbi:trehalose 6-phosphate phosphatase [Marchantia polymorpha subsp. ruderalis]|uniref:Trehalose 6-phosphate phosphatase n=2 Tax=Marchantia polymorpha TaxID=3197 RepID=A0AAF6AN11_MARPO|nr:hypothetical protein MARPO_0036s0112 [Marchantia polymorpha]BBM97831.1 hypothetical protein Mp_1g08690 [Marchantia polymorpha subsp. ruderalis]|eukprot:PTQ41134.1 hypothetical protein MARPO_0036s0112 [Marchantia polymorpha]
MAWRSNHQAVYPDPSLPFSSPGCPSASLSISSTTASSYPPSSRTLTFSKSIPIPSKKIEACNTQNKEVLGWLDAMKAQSPPRFESYMGGVLDPKAQEAAAVAQYSAWRENHPSALEMFDELMEEAAGKQIVVFLDYDGTLSPIVEDPDRAYMSDLMRATVKEVATHFPTAIISGRGREKVYDFVQLAELYYAGSHGMDIMGPAEGCNGFKATGTRAKDKKGNEVVFFQPASKFLPMMDEVCKLLEDKAQSIPGAKIEHNKYCVTIHFRRVKEECWGPLAEQVEIVLKSYPELQLTLGRKVLEIRPAIEWDKGKAVEFLLKSLGLEDVDDVLPVYLGDDRTDEDAFMALNDRGKAFSILVSTVAKSTNALYSLRDPSEVMTFLQTLVRWREGHPQSLCKPADER